jgi:protein-S-isoprenylcysteine O-methyltransferase
MNSSIFIWIIYSLWIILILYLTVTAFGAKEDTQEHPVQSYGIVFVVIISFILPHFSVFRFLNFAAVNPVISCIGVIICLIGMVFNIWARQKLGKNWSQAASAKKEQELITSGPYRYVRHPMYAGGITACLGSAFVMGGAWIFLFVILGGIFLWRVGVEDRIMEQQFPDEFPAYKQSTKALIPFVL